VDFVGVPLAPFEGVLNCARVCSLVGVPLDGSGRDPSAGELPASRNLELGVLLPAAARLGVEALLGRMLSR
jgi:hypothetical protein